MKYTVRNSPSNPRNKTEERFDTKADAVAAMREMLSDDAGECSDLIVGDNVIATRHWNKSRITWLK